MSWAGMITAWWEVLVVINDYGEMLLCFQLISQRLWFHCGWHGNKLHSAGTGSLPSTITLFTCSARGGELLLKAFFKVMLFAAVHKPNVYPSILRKLRATPRINKPLKWLHKGPVFSPTEAIAQLILRRGPCDGPPPPKTVWGPL